MGAHRMPPLPHWRQAGGACRWCGEPTLKPDGSPSKRIWHDACVTAYKIASSSEFQRRACWNRDAGICAACRVDTATLWLGWRRVEERWVWEDERIGRATYIEPARTWEADHVVPLWSVDRNADDAVQYWLIGNLQTLCVPCHAVKTKREAGERARQRRPLPLMAAVPA